MYILRQCGLWDRLKGNVTVALLFHFHYKSILNQISSQYIYKVGKWVMFDGLFRSCILSLRSEIGIIVKLEDLAMVVVGRLLLAERHLCIRNGLLLLLLPDTPDSLKLNIFPAG